MKCDILDNKIIINKGIFNNIDVMENSVESFRECFKKKYVLRVNVQHLIDGNFIFFENDGLERLFNLKDSLKEIAYDDLDYISKFKIPKLINLIDLIDNNLVILNISNLSKKEVKKLLNDLKKFTQNIIIESSNIKILKYVKDNNFLVSLIINKRNRRYINFIFKPNIYNIDINLFDNKLIKKLREKYYVISQVKDVKEYNVKKDVYDNLIIENCNY